MNRKLLYIKSLVNSKLWVKADQAVDQLYEEWCDDITELSNEEVNTMFGYIDRISKEIYGNEMSENDMSVNEMYDRKDLMEKIEEDKLILQYLDGKVDKEEKEYIENDIKELEKCLEKKH